MRDFGKNSVLTGLNVVLLISALLCRSLPKCCHHVKEPDVIDAGVRYASKEPLSTGSLYLFCSMALTYIDHGKCFSRQRRLYRVSWKQFSVSIVHPHLASFVRRTISCLPSPLKSASSGVPTNSNPMRGWSGNPSIIKPLRLIMDRQFADCIRTSFSPSPSISAQQDHSMQSLEGWFHNSFVIVVDCSRRVYSRSFPLRRYNFLLAIQPLQAASRLRKQAEPQGKTVRTEYHQRKRNIHFALKMKRRQNGDGHNRIGSDWSLRNYTAIGIQLIECPSIRSNSSESESPVQTQEKL